MLSRTASDLYWMSRYLERAENLARMLDVSYSLSLMPQDGRGDGLDELAMPLLITGTLDDYLERHGPLHAERMLHFFALDAENPASLYCCLQAARANGGPVWYLLYDDEGHGFRKKANSDYFNAASMQFWQTYLLGR